MRLWIMAVLAFVVGVTGGTGYVLFLAPGEEGDGEATLASAGLPEEPGAPPPDRPAELPGTGDRLDPDQESSATEDAAPEVPPAGDEPDTPEVEPHGDDAQGEPAAPAPDSGAPDDDLIGSTAPGLPTPAATPSPPAAGATRPAAGNGTGGGVPSPAADVSRRMARIFAAMKPAEAAAVLQQLSDEEVGPVLLLVGERPAAQILGAFEPERAASLSRVVLGRGEAP